MSKRKELLLSLPVPITENHAYFYRMGRKNLNAAAKKWMSNAEEITRGEIERQHWETTAKHKVVVEIHTYWPDARVRDTHNSYKLLFDALENAKVFDNDRYALARQIDYSIDRENPRVDLKIYLKEVTEVD